MERGRGEELGEIESANLRVCVDGDGVHYFFSSNNILSFNGSLVCHLGKNALLEFSCRYISVIFN
jgi:uncharacterized membrane protein